MACSRRVRTAVCWWRWRSRCRGVEWEDLEIWIADAVAVRETGYGNLSSGVPGVLAQVEATTKKDMERQWQIPLPASLNA